MSVRLSKGRRVRRSFGTLAEITQMPDLIEVQRKSYNQFLQPDEKQRSLKGLEGIFRSFFPIRDLHGRVEIDFLHYSLERINNTVRECLERGLTYAIPVKATLQIKTLSDKKPEIKQENVYLGEMPLMTENGTFIINGTERVIVSQMHRSPGVFFDKSSVNTYSAHVIPYHGSWLDLEFDAKDCLYVRIDRRRKFLATTLLYALDDEKTQAVRNGALPNDYEPQGLSREYILGQFYSSIPYRKNEYGWCTAFDPERLKNTTLTEDLVNGENGEVCAVVGTKLTQAAAETLYREGLRLLLVDAEHMKGRYLARDYINEKSGEIYAEAGDEITPALWDTLQQTEIVELAILDQTSRPYIHNTLLLDHNHTRSEALQDIYRIIRPGEPMTSLETIDHLFQGLFFDPERYNLSAVGRAKMNERLNMSVSEEIRFLRTQDIIEILKILIGLRESQGEVDDIDHLGNRRVRSVGELIENQVRIGFHRMEKMARERLNSIDTDTLLQSMPRELINTKPISVAIRELFNSSQLSQFMDQTNPLSEITHKRRLSALGPGGLVRERAGFQVRDVHPTHYGRICPVETPEGPNIGLISSLATFARINDYGFIETPYRRVVDARVTDEVVYLSATEESKYIISQADVPLDESNRFAQELVTCRQAGEYALHPAQDVDYIDVSSKQTVSIAAALIPFLENDDANRVLMGSNMQRQAVPLLRVEAPLVGTGMEAKVAQDSGVTVIAKRAGVVDQVDATRIVIRADHEHDWREISGLTVDIYQLSKFQRSNQNTCINQKPLVKVGERVEKGTVIADGPCTHFGELALGRNILVAFMPWNGYNFEDSITISERLVYDDVFTSIHIEEFEITTRDSKLGTEEITRDIPNVGEEALRHLDESGIIHVGSEVKPNDILVGRVSPKSESPITAEEKLLRAIFGEKAPDVRDTSLRAPSGVSGTVIEVRILSRQGIEKDHRTQLIENLKLKQFKQDRDDQRSILEKDYASRLRTFLLEHQVAHSVETVEEGEILTQKRLFQIPNHLLKKIKVVDSTLQRRLEEEQDSFDKLCQELELQLQERIEKLQAGNELQPGVIKVVKVCVAVKRKIQPGDKMAGRHGNKGVVSRIVPIEDMPHLENGQAVDIVLNPLSIPSRMNIGQILETHLGWTSIEIGKQITECLKEIQSAQDKERKPALKNLKNKLKQIYTPEQYKDNFHSLTETELLESAKLLSLGVPYATPVFDGAREKDISDHLEKAYLPRSGQVWLIDGRTGEYFDRPVTVGYIYMLKLHHLVDDKIHARSTGSYSLVTQQPLGGKANFGGQRLGEMEVWALEAYGAACTLREMLTIKSDDVGGRLKTYDNLTQGQETFQTGIPESFNVLLKELQALGLFLHIKEYFS